MNATAALPDKDTPIILERPDISVMEEGYGKEREMSGMVEAKEMPQIPDFSEMLQMVYQDEISEEEQITVEEEQFNQSMEKELQELRKWKQEHEKEEEKNPEVARDRGQENKRKKAKVKNVKREKDSESIARKREKFLIPFLMFLAAMAVLVSIIGIMILFF